MKIKARHRIGLSLVEVALVLATIALLFFLLMSWTSKPVYRSKRISCTSNLKQIGLSYRLWSNDHNDQFPFASTNVESSLRFVNSWQVFRHFQVMSNELITPKVLVCNSDSKRTRAIDFVNFSNTNISYFVGLDAREDSPQSILSGDRNITGGTLSKGFLRLLNPTTQAGWTKEMHENAGNIGLGDGSVQQVTGSALNRQLSASTNATIRLAIP